MNTRLRTHINKIISSPDGFFIVLHYKQAIAIIAKVF